MRQHLERAIWLAVASIALVTMITSGYYLLSLQSTHDAEIAQLEKASEQRGRQLTESVGQQVDAILLSVDLVLRQLRTSYVEDRQHFDTVAKEVLRAFPPDMLQSVTVFDADGYLAYSSSGTTERINFGSLEYFPHHQQIDSDELFVSRPIIGRLSDIPLIQLTRPIHKAGRLVGVIGIPLRPDYLANKLNGLHANPGDLLFIVRQDGSFVTRSRNLRDALNTRVPADRPYLKARAGETGMFRSTSSVDKIPLMFSWLRMSHWPLVVGVGLDEQSARNLLLESHAQDRLRAFAAIGFMIVFASLVCLLLLRQAASNHRLAASEQRFRKFFEANRAVMLLIRPNNGRITEANQAAEDYYGFGPGKLLGKSIADINTLPPEQVAAERQRALREERNYFNFRHRLANGEVRNVEVYSTPIELADGPVLFSVVHDVTERVRLECNLRDRMTELGAILDNSAVGINLVRERRVIWCNYRMGEIFGYAPEELAGTSTQILYQSSDLYRLLGTEAYPRLARGERHVSEQVMRRKDGSPVWVRVSGKAVAAAQPDQGSIWVFEDIDQQKAREQELRAARHAAEAATEAKGRFLATMSHEIRTPMNAVLGMAQLLQLDLKQPEQVECVTTILHAGKTLLTLLDDILDISRIDAGKLVLEQRPVDPALLLHEIRALYGEAARTKGLMVEQQWHGPLGQRYLGDPNRLHQMLANLVSNAIKFTSAGEVRIQGTELARDGDHAWLELSVRDSGIGIAPERRADIFDPFVQGDSSTAREFGGSGLGLSIVRQLARLMEGEVEFDSEPGKGSCFRIRVRVPLLAEGGVDLNAGNVEPDRFHGRVLIVDDDLTGGTILARLLEHLGLSVDVVSDGRMARERVTENTVDLILLDISMPAMDGYATAQSIREWEAGGNAHHLPIVAITGSVSAPARERCRNAGIDDVLTKPVDFDALRRVLATRLDPVAKVSPPAVPCHAPDTAELARIRDAVAVLLPLLAESRFSAVAQFAELVALTRHTTLAPSIAVIEPLLRDLRFEQVRQGLVTLIEAPPFTGTLP